VRRRHLEQQPDGESSATRCIASWRYSHLPARICLFRKARCSCSRRSGLTLSTSSIRSRVGLSAVRFSSSRMDRSTGCCRAILASDHFACAPIVQSCGRSAPPQRAPEIRAGLRPVCGADFAGHSVDRGTGRSRDLIDAGGNGLTMSREISPAGLLLPLSSGALLGSDGAHLPLVIGRILRQQLVDQFLSRLVCTRFFRFKDGVDACVLARVAGK
jgi:hypothetical protein